MTDRIDTFRPPFTLSSCIRTFLKTLYPSINSVGAFFCVLSFSSTALANGGIAQIYMDFENRMEPYEVMPYRSPDPSGKGNGCMGGEAWNEYYKFNVCISPTCDLSDYSIERSSKYARSGNQSLRFFLKPTLPNHWPDGEANHRAELAPHHNSPIARYPSEGEEFWYGISYYFPSDFMFAPKAIENDIRFIIAQWQHGSPGSPIIALEVMGDKVVLQRQAGVSENSDWIDPVSIGKIQRGQWMDIVVQAKWSKKNGLVNIWVNGSQTYSQSNIQTIYSDLNVGGGFKIGLYYWRWKEMQSVQNSLDAGITYREIFIDEVREYHGSQGFDVASPAQSALPIEWLNFDATLQETQKVKLAWRTATETNNDHFVIERSNDGLNWQAIEHIGGAGNSDRESSYQSLDPDPPRGMSYYRIKQVDFDGQFSYSPARSILMKATNNIEVKIYPNPTTHTLFLEGQTDDLQDLAFCNVIGQDISGLIDIMEDGPTSLAVDVSRLPSGIFTLKTRSFVRQVFKQ